jgi:putative redox protein
MADSLRSVSLTRTGAGSFRVTNVRGGFIDIVSGGSGPEFSPVELLLAAIGGCTGMDVEVLTSRRSEPSRFEVDVTADKIRDEAGNRLENIVVTFRTTFGADEGGEAARELLPEAVRKSHDRLCTVSRTVELGTPVANVIE